MDQICLLVPSRRWVFDLVLSNPETVKLYRMSPGSTSRHSAVLTDPPAAAEHRQELVMRAGGRS
jgi:hypothetical protein